MLKIFKKMALLILLLALIYLAILGVYFFFPRSFIRLQPANFSHLNQPKVEVSLFIPSFPGLEWKFEKIQIDEVAFPLDFFKGGWSKKADFILSEGQHRLRIAGSLELLRRYKKTISFNHNYGLDFTAPFLKVANSLKENVYYPTSTWSFQARTEPLSLVYVFSPTSHSYLLKADKKGFIKGKIFLASGENDLVFKVLDQAENAAVYKKKVYVDPISPVLGEVFPPDGELAQTRALYLRAEVSDNLALKGGSFWVNGKLLKGVWEEGGRRKSKSLVSILPITEDGTYTVKVKVKDLAGNLAVKKWKFSLDTTFIVVDLSERRLYLYRNGKIIRSYRVAVGRFDFPTPVGDWKIIGKRRNPVWRNPHMNWSKDMPEFIPPGPGNPLGPRALDLSAPLVRIHGTPQIGSIGHAASHGCIRMYPWNVIELFDLVKVGTPVRIQW